jgi:hypothetical protein
MRLKTAAVLASVWLAGSGMAFGQTVDSGMEVTVNPVTGGRGGLLLYPGDQYMRRVQPALEPGETLKDQGPIQLHMPVRRKTVRKTPTTQTATAEQAPAVTPAPEKPRPKPTPPPKAAVAAAAAASIRARRA